MPTETPLRPTLDLADPTTLTLDLDNPKPKELLAIDEAFKAAIRSNPDLGPLPVTTGWNEITPAIAVNLLLRNRHNRWLDTATVFYYADQMVDGDWQATGQPILIDNEDKLLDAQHRLYGVVVSGQTIKSYVVTEIEALPDMFARIDNGKVRSASDALRTAGLNGVSPVITKVLRFAEEVRVGLHNPTGASKLARFSPVQMLRLVNEYPNVKIASRSASSDWSEAVNYLDNRKDIVAYVGMLIINNFDEGTADDFFSEVIDSDETRANDHPIAALRKKVDEAVRSPKKMKRQFLAAILIQTFNAWISEETLSRRWVWNKETENFPTMVEREEQAQAAE